MKFIDHIKNPIIKPRFWEIILADPTVITPDASPDKQWYLFTHTVWGINQYVSRDGVNNWKKVDGPNVKWGIRPFIFKDQGIYYLVYEKMTKIWKFPWYESHLEIITSIDLLKWSSKIVITIQDFKYNNISCPSVIKKEGLYWLYFSYGLVYIPGHKFCEPKGIMVGKAKKISGLYKTQKLSFSKSDYRTIALKIFSENNKQLQALQLRMHHQNYKAIMGITTSSNGINWKDFNQPQILPDAKWKNLAVYTGEVKKFAGKQYVYYNVRDWSGRESISLSYLK